MQIFFPVPVIVKVKVFLSMFSKFCPYFFLKNCLTFFHTFFHLFGNLLKTHIHLQYRIDIKTFLGTFVHEIWQSIWWINLSYLLWLLLRSSSKCSGHCESESVSINVFQCWSNFFLLQNCLTFFNTHCHLSWDLLKKLTFFPI